jgi:hypothetical protein
MSIFQSAFATVALSFALTCTLPGSMLAAPNCEITKCRSGGNVTTCWASIKQEANSKSKSCSKLVIGSGISAYAMALSLPGVCIKSNAVIKIHRPYDSNLQAVPLGSRWHTYYFGRIRPAAVGYFKAKGGMQREGFANAAFMVSVPAAKTGVPICKPI